MGDPTAATRAVNAERRRSGRGLLDPNPGAIGRRLAPTPTLASGVTVAAAVTSSDPMSSSAASASSTIASSRAVVWTDALWSNLCGVPWIVSGVSFPHTKYGLTKTYLTSSVQRYETDVEFDHYGRYFEVGGYYINTGSRYRIVVDGNPVALDSADIGGAAGNLFLLPVDLGSVALRRIRVELIGAGFAGIRVGPNDDAMPSSADPGPLVAILSDSFGEGAGLSTQKRSWPYALARAMGWRRILNGSVGGTGYLNNGGAGKATYRGRLAADIIARSPDIVIVAGGYNDSTFADAAIQTEAGLLFDAIRAGLPQATLVVVGPWTNKGTPTAKLLTIRDAVYAAQQGKAHAWIDPIGGPQPYAGTVSPHTDTGWVRGSGDTSHLTGIGTADLYVQGVDGVHPTAVGQDWLGRYIAQKATRLLPL